MNKRIVSLTLSLDATSSNEDAVRQFITAVGLYGMGAFDFQVFEDDDDMIMVNGREAMLATMPDQTEREEVREDQVRTDLEEDVEDVDVDWPGDEEE